MAAPIERAEDAIKAAKRATETKARRQRRMDIMKSQNRKPRKDFKGSPARVDEFVAATRQRRHAGSMANTSDLSVVHGFGGCLGDLVDAALQQEYATSVNAEPPQRKHEFTMASAYSPHPMPLQKLDEFATWDRRVVVSKDADVVKAGYSFMQLVLTDEHLAFGTKRDPEAVSRVAAGLDDTDDDTEHAPAGPSKRALRPINTTSNFPKGKGNTQSRGAAGSKTQGSKRKATVVTKSTLAGPSMLLTITNVPLGLLLKGKNNNTLTTSHSTTGTKRKAATANLDSPSTEPTKRPRVPLSTIPSVPENKDSEDKASTTSRPAVVPTPQRRPKPPRKVTVNADGSCNRNRMDSIRVQPVCAPQRINVNAPRCYPAGWKIQKPTKPTVAKRRADSADKDEARVERPKRLRLSPPGPVSEEKDETRVERPKRLRLSPPRPPPGDDEETSERPPAGSSPKTPAKIKGKGKSSPPAENNEQTISSPPAGSGPKAPEKAKVDKGKAKASPPTRANLSKPTPKPTRSTSPNYLFKAHARLATLPTDSPQAQLIRNSLSALDDSHVKPSPKRCAAQPVHYTGGLPTDPRFADGMPADGYAPRYEGGLEEGIEMYEAVVPTWKEQSLAEKAQKELDEGREVEKERCPGDDGLVPKDQVRKYLGGEDSKYDLGVLLDYDHDEDELDRRERERERKRVEAKVKAKEWGFEGDDGFVRMLMDVEEGERSSEGSDGKRRSRRKGRPSRVRVEMDAGEAGVKK